MNLYSNKQKWKITLLIVALLLVGASLFVSNEIVSKVGLQEKQRAKQWADAIKKKVELVQLVKPEASYEVLEMSLVSETLILIQHHCVLNFLI